MLNSNITAFTAEQLEPLILDEAALISECEEHSLHSENGVDRNAEGHFSNVKHSMRMVGNGVSNSLSSLNEAAQDAGKARRRFQEEHDVMRGPKHPDKLLSLLFVVIFVFFETLLTAGSLFADGHVEPIVALGFGLMFSAVNAGLGMSAGACSRYLDYRLNRVRQLPQYAKTRQLAKSGMIAILSINAMMILVAGRVRAVGGHEGVFNFSEVGLFETFNDGLGLVIMVAAALSSGIAFLKGRSGFSDPLPDYSEIAGTSRDVIDKDADDVAQNGLLELDDLLANAEEELLAFQVLPEDLAELNERLNYFKADVEIAKNEVLVFAISEYERNRFIEGKDTGKPDVDLSAFDALLSGINVPEFSPSNQDALDELRRVHAEVGAAILEAHAHYLASVQSDRFLPPQNPANT